MNGDNKSSGRPNRPLAADSSAARLGETSGEKVAEPLQTVTWDHLDAAAESIFDVWLTGSEVEWAKAAWKALEKKGLSKYS